MFAGVDYITMGNHTFKHEDIEEILEQKDNIIRPAN
jgi:calcineurin-like phosphoesterase